MSYSTSGSGGGGFQGFPYRSSHQQGNDNSTQNNNNNRKKGAYRFQNRRKRGGAITCHARFRVPPSCRNLLIGQKGIIINNLTNETRCVINVPGKKQLENPNAMVVIQASCIDFLLHGCWEVLNIVCAAENSFNSGNSLVSQSTALTLQPWLLTRERHTEMKYFIDQGGSRFNGNKVNLHGLFLNGTINNTSDVEVSVYCIPTKHEIDEDSISIIVDNQRFVDPNIKAQISVVSRIDIIKSFAKSKFQQNLYFYDHPTLIFVYGSKEDKTLELFESILQGVADFEKCKE